MKIVVVSGSSRPQSQSRKIASWIEAKLASLGTIPFIVDLHMLHLPWDVNLDVPALKETPEALMAWEPVRSHMQEADAFVFVSPEWNGMVPPALLQFILYASADETKPLAHKPIQLFTVSSGKGGAYPSAELKAFGMKNAQGFYIPGYVIIRQCKEVFNALEPEVGNESDIYLQERAGYSLKLLMQYATAMKDMRAASEINLLQYPNGM